PIARMRAAACRVGDMRARGRCSACNRLVATQEVQVCHDIGGRRWGALEAIQPNGSPTTRAPRDSLHAAPFGVGAKRPPLKGGGPSGPSLPPLRPTAEWSFGPSGPWPSALSATHARRAVRSLPPAIRTALTACE